MQNNAKNVKKGTLRQYRGGQLRANAPPESLNYFNQLETYQ